MLLVDALYADGPFLAWCKSEQGIDVLVPIPGDRELHQDLEQLAQGGLLPFQRHSYVRTIQGHKQRRTLDLGAQSGLTSWDSFLEAAKAAGADHPSLWGCLIRPVEPTSKDDVPWTLVSTRNWVSGVAACEGFRPRWQIENGEFRELKEGWGLEAERWGRNLDVQRGRVTLTCLAFNTAQAYLTQRGPEIAAKGIRRIWRLSDDQLGHSPVVIYIGHDYGVFPVEELLRLIGRPSRQSLRTALTHRSRAPPRPADRDSSALSSNVWRFNSCFAKRSFHLYDLYFRLTNLAQGTRPRRTTPHKNHARARHTQDGRPGGL